MSTFKKIAVALLIAVSATNVGLAQDQMDNKKMEMREHKCTAACKDGKHVYAHGEKGHVCTRHCRKMMKKHAM